MYLFFSGTTWWGMDSDVVLVAIITLIGVIITAIFGYMTTVITTRTSKEVAEINDAVNHRHEKEGPPLKLYDVVMQNHFMAKELIEWKNTYKTSPIADGEKASDYFEEIEERVQTLEHESDHNLPKHKVDDSKDK